ncbi:hypothetical protein Bbelb_360660 [Branchiostoma belcheri]|nr:hypothetical protein Bbelb_360660 [Branchiostoma belcheri]
MGKDAFDTLTLLEPRGHWEDTEENTKWTLCFYRPDKRPVTKRLTGPSEVNGTDLKNWPGKASDIDKAVLLALKLPEWNRLTGPYYLEGRMENICVGGLETAHCGRASTPCAMERDHVVGNILITEVAPTGPVGTVLGVGHQPALSHRYKFPKGEVPGGSPE